MSLDTRTDLPDAQRLLASLPHAVLLLENGRTIAWLNPAAEQFFGQSARRLVGTRLRDIMSISDRRLLDRLSDSEAPVSAREIVVQIKGKGARRIDINVGPVADSPGWQVVSLHDNSASEALGDDSGGPDNAVLRGPEIMAHEIKNPLAGIRGAAQLLARKVDERDKALTDLITGEVDRVAGLIERMQKLSGRTTPPVEPCNLHEAARRAIDVLNAAKAEKPAFRLVEEFDPSLPSVLGSPDGLVQVMMNLLSNAADACKHVAEPRVIIRTRFASGLQLHTGDDGAPLRLPIEVRVSDNGPGIDPAMRDHIFEPFVTTKKSGQGLGLPLVRKLVRDMNGRITHDRDDENGLTHFRIHLPLARETRNRPRRKTA
ncbi:ATP-binding protein [Novosphingobium resinovorum]|uniref:histidine kinase n=1 Tax=Novosphingobium resinovorum TaxID=158500 RepID=A0A031K2N0_9SPHN|nr:MULTISPECIES: ATP-binding protein [Sphingomonadaceae]AOR76055.1 PAS domain-containing sensor histidine kinase [Novosphingobium resinovorum]EJU14110.1 two-component system NtrC family nitrogen regulation sensor histidine kinase GlnL [Sphingomonas sp. LH128]EZP83469.1 Two-component system NtrC family nitrogen regulation sensor histidine kinase GlnL [Novosphingobium resinovorum]MBF7011437.1 PAS domain-containing protein [Novosphingobium sp. HR1a]WJM29415.1 ATP-binding protein [Novosphingobium 